jgi:hypothetical protein
MNMKNFVKFFVSLAPLVLVGLFFVTNSANAQVSNQTITLSRGWNIVSTPKVLSSHQFSAPETSANFNIYLLDPTSTSGWQTMQGVGQTEFKPLYAYFINNETGTNQTLQLNYNFTLEPQQRLFQRTLNVGWNTIGIASPSYALSQGSPSSIDTNNPSNILSSIAGSVSQVIDFTNGNTNLDSPSISNTWADKTVADANSLNDFRELKGYGVFVTNATNNYLGSENLQVTSGVAPVITLNGVSTVNLTVGSSYADAGATASDSLDGDITSKIVVVNPVDTSTAGTYHITYNVTDSSGNSAQQVTRTVNVQGYGILSLSTDSSNPIGNNIVEQSNQTSTGNTALVFNLKNTSNYTTTVESVNATINNVASVSAYYLYNGGTSIESLGNPNSTTLSFNSFTPFTIAPNTSVVMSIKFDASANASGTVQVSIPVGTDVSVNIPATVTGSATGNNMVLISGGSVSVNLVGSPTFTTAPATVSSTTGYTSGTFQFNVSPVGVSLADLSKAGAMTVVGNTITNSGGSTSADGVTYLAGTSPITNYVVSPVLTNGISDGNTANITVTINRTDTRAGNVTFAVTGLRFAKTGWTTGTAMTDFNSVGTTTGLSNATVTGYTNQ